MEFQTKLVQYRKNVGARISDAGGIVFFTSILSGAVLEKLDVSKYGFYALLGFGLSIVLLIVGRRMARGNLSHTEISDTDLMVSNERIMVGDQSYMVGEMQDLDFWIEGYYGMATFRTRSYRRNRLNGMGNKLHFKVNGERHLYQFFLEDLLSMQQLGQVFRQFYENQTPFAERNRGGQTFLFQQIRSKRELEEMKRREGYA
jgi:hypothetical protein